MKAVLLRIAVVVLAAAGLASLVWWRGPDWHLVKHTFDQVRYEWVVLAIGLNLLSVVLRAFAWSASSRMLSCPGGSASSRASPF